MSETTELIELPSAEAAVDVFTATDKLDAILDQVRQKVSGIVYDMGKRTDRELCRSDAFKVARCKSAAKDLGATTAKRLKELPKLVDAGRRYLEDGLEEIQKQVRQPLTEWEEAEDARVQTHKDAVAGILRMAEELGGATAADIRARLEMTEGIGIGTYWEEFEAEAHRAKAKTLEVLRAALAAREKYEAEQAELAELRRKQAEQERKDREAEIARQAAEKARADAEAAAQAEREAAAKREADAKAAAEQAERDKQEAIERQKQAEARAEAEKLAAEQRAKDAAEAARQAEIDRVAREKAAAEAEQRRREADREHRAKVNRTALQAFIGGGMPEECAKQAVTLIAKGEIPAVTINY